MDTIEDDDAPPGGLPTIPQGPALLAVTGIDPLLTRRFRRPTIAEMQRSQRIARIIRTSMRAFMDMNAPEKRPRMAAAPPFDFDELADHLSASIGPAHLADCMSRFGDMQELGLDYVSAAEPALNYLRTWLPADGQRTPTGARPVRPSDDEVSKFRRIYNVATDPLCVLVNLNAGVITSDEVDALEAMFPAVYGPMREIFALETAAKLTRSPTWEMGPRKTQLSQTFLKANMFDLDLALEIQHAFRAMDKEQQSQAPQGGPATTKSADRFLTTAQKIEAGEKTY